jgi:hypothetical protein
MKTLYLAALAAAFVVAWSPSSAQVRSPCDKLAGAEKERCLAQEKEQEKDQRERLGREESKPRSCDALFGPEKEICLKRGGTVRAGTPSDGASRR